MGGKREIGGRIFRKSKVDSTNRLALSGDFPPVSAIVAETQSGGVGRRSRHWASPPGGLYLSLVLTPARPLEDYHLLSLFAAEAVLSAAVDAAPGPQFRIKWPNDVMAGSRKLCGILLQSISGKDDRLALGMGINLNSHRSDFPPEIRDNISILRELAGEEIDRRLFLDNLLEKLDAAYRDFIAGRISERLGRINRVLYRRGEWADFTIGGRARKLRVVEIIPNGKLRARDSAGDELDIGIGELGN